MTVDYTIVTELRKKNEICREKMNAFEKKYKTLFQEAVYYLQKKEYDEFEDKLNELRAMMNSSNEDIVLCYKTLQQDHEKYLKSKKTNKFDSSYIDNLQNETAKEYVQYKKKRDELQKLQETIKSTTDERNILIYSMQDENNVDSVYYTFHVWLIITILLLFGVFVYSANYQTPLNSLVGFIAICVSFYFIFKNILII